MPSSRSTSPRFYSQNGEDVLAALLLGDKTDGFFVEIGCIDGRRYSNTLHFEEKGWHGLCIEAHPDYIGLLQHNRPGSIIEHAAAGAKDAPEVRFYADRRGSISTLDPSNEAAAKRMFRPMFTGYEERTVPMLTLNTIFRKHAVQHIDVLSLDIEGMEVQAMRGLDLQIYRPTLLIIEAETRTNHEALEALLLPAGYQVASTVHQNIFFSLDPAHHALLKSRPREGAILTHTANPMDRAPDLVQAMRFHYQHTAPDQLHIRAHAEAVRVAGAPPAASSSAVDAALTQAKNELAQGHAVQALQHAGQARDISLQQEASLQAIAETHLEIAHLYFERGRRGEAQKTCEQAIKIRHDLAPAYALLGRIHRAREKHRQADRAEATHRLLTQLSATAPVQPPPPIDTISRQAVFLAQRFDLKQVIEIGRCEDRSLREACHAVESITFVSQDASSVETLLSDLMEPALFVLHTPEDAPPPSLLPGLLEAILYHPIRNHILLLHRPNGTRAFEAIALEQMLRQRDNPLLFQIETRGNLILIYPSRKHLQAYRNLLGAVSKSRFSLPLRVTLPAQIDPSWLELPLFISYPRSGSHWINAVMECYLNRPRLRAERITFLPRERNDYLWLHDHDMGLHLRHDRVLYLYRNPVDVLYSYAIAERRRIDEAFVRWHMQHLKKHLEKYLLSEERAHTAVRYERFVEDFPGEFKQVMQFFEQPFDAERLAEVQGMVTKEALAQKGADTTISRYINTFLLEEDYQVGREHFRETHGPMIEDHIINGDLEPFFI